MERLDPAFVEQALGARARSIAALRESSAHRDQLFKELVCANADTSFGGEHGFAKLTRFDEYRMAVPIRDYAGLAPWIERSAGGERRVLTVEEPEVFFRTSASSGASKKIPYNENAFHRYAVPRIHTDFGFFLHYYPELADDTGALLDLRHDPRPSSSVTASGVPWISRTSYRPSRRSFLRGWRPEVYRAPPTVEGYANRAYARLRLAATADIRFIICLNPSTLLLYAQQLESRTELLVRDIYEGTILGNPATSPNPERARALEELARQGALTPSRLWPQLRCILCWKSGLAALYLEQVAQLYGEGVKLEPYPATATEARMTFLYDRHPTAGLLCVDAALFEFVPATEEFRPDSPTLLHEELTVGKEYSLVMTNEMGLYRYDIGDVFRVAEQVEGVPRLEFVGRRGSVSSFTGEKLYESQIVDAVRAAERDEGVRIQHYICLPTFGSPPYYEFVVEGVDRAAQERLASSIDRNLSAMNEEYRDKRDSGRLGRATVEHVRTGTFVRFWSNTLSAQVDNQTQFKPRVLERHPAARSTLFGIDQSLAEKG
jgi:hypothetical protein